MHFPKERLVIEKADPAYTLLNKKRKAAAEGRTKQAGCRSEGEAKKKRR